MPHSNIAVLEYKILFPILFSISVVDNSIKQLTEINFTLGITETPY